MFGAKDQGATATATVTTAPATTVARPLRLKADGAFPWRRFAISIMGILIILFVWRWSINHLYTLPPTSISAFASITNNSLYVIGFLVAFFVTGQAYFTNWSNVSAANIVSEAKSYFQSKTESKTDKKTSRRTDKTG